jgi:hypothetical protein
MHADVNAALVIRGRAQWALTSEPHRFCRVSDAALIGSPDKSNNGRVIGGELVERYGRDVVPASSKLAPATSSTVAKPATTPTKQRNTSPKRERV